MNVRSSKSQNQHHPTSSRSIRRASLPRPPHRDTKNPDVLQCPHFPACSGCTIADQHTLFSPPIFQEAQSFFGSLPKCGPPSPPPPTLQVGSIHHWRHRARLAVRNDKHGNFSIGLFRQNTHDIIDIVPNCVVHHPLLNTATLMVKNVAKDMGIQAYDERTGKGQLRYIQLTVAVGNPSYNTENLQIQLTLVWNADSLDSSVGLSEFASHLWKRSMEYNNDKDALLCAIYANFQSSPTNTILGSETVLLHGNDHTAWYPLHLKLHPPLDKKQTPLHIAFDPGSFLQSNPDGLSAVVEEMVTRWVPSGSHIIDLYAGVGTLGIAIAATVDIASLKAVEIVPSSEHSFWTSWRHLTSHKLIRNAMRVDYIVDKAGSDPKRWFNCGSSGSDRSTVLLVDPPRKGLEPSLLQFLCETSNVDYLPNRIIYLSCGFPALQRDLLALLSPAQSLWTLRTAKAYLFFPGTNHIETLVVLDRT